MLCASNYIFLYVGEKIVMKYHLGRNVIRVMAIYLTVIT